jgi:hypothetical protein
VTSEPPLEDRGRPGPPISAIETALLRRGHLVHSLCPAELVLAPSGQASAGDREVFYQALRRYSFRLLLRDIIARRQGFTAAAVTRYASPEVTARDLEALCAMGLLKRDGETYALAGTKVASFGETLEWYVATILEREFHYATAWGIKLAGESEGCDYDVLATAGGRLLYVETKASPPKNIHEPQIRGFLDRTRRLGPDMAIFLVDTELRLEDKILVMFREVLPEPLAQELSPAPEPQSIYRTRSGLCIANSRRDVIENLRLCLRALYQGQWRV